MGRSAGTVKDGGAPSTGGGSDCRSGLAGALAQAASQLRQARRVVLATHVNPDGDTLGSALALAHALRASGSEAVVLSQDGVPDIYTWLPGAGTVLTQTESRDFDLGVVCDTGTLARVGSRVRPAIEAARRSLCVDHHVAEGDFGDIRLVDSTSASTGEIVWHLLRSMGAHLDRAIADCLLCAIVTDTGSFKYPNTTPATLRIAADLVERGADPAAINELVFENRSLASLKLLGRALDSLQVSHDGQIAWAHVRARDYEELGASDEETEGIVGHVRAVRGARVGLLFREIPGRKIRVSLRSREGYDVNAVAQKFGGGGHRLAAGCSLDPPLEEAERLLLAEAARHL